MITITTATLDDAEDILALQKLAYQSEARLYDDWSIPPLTQTIESLQKEFPESLVLKAVSDSRIVGSVRARLAEGTCTIGRLIVDPQFQRQGIGSKLLQSAEAECEGSSKFELFTGTKSEANIRLYQRHGYAITRTEQLSPSVLISCSWRNLGLQPPDPGRRHSAARNSKSEAAGRLPRHTRS